MDLVKRSENGMITNPVTCSPDDTLAEVDARCAQYRISGVPVVDATGLEGQYELTLSFSLPAAPESNADIGPTLYEAVEQQLGLKLKPAKRPVEVFVIDHLDRTPVEN